MVCVCVRRMFVYNVCVRLGCVCVYVVCACDDSTKCVWAHGDVCVLNVSSVYVLSGAVYMYVVERAHDLGQGINIFANRYKFDNFFQSY